MPLDYDKIMPIVKNVATQVSSKFPAYVQTDDTMGALLLFIYQKRSSIENAVEDGSGWEAKIASTLRKVAFDHCQAEKAASEGYDPDGIYRYPIDRIKVLIPIALDYQGWQQYDAWDEGVNLFRKQKFSLDEVVDIKRGIATLPEDTAKLLVYQYKYGYTFEEAAEALNITFEAVRKRSQRSLKALQKNLGYKETSPLSQARRRSVRTNAGWRAELSTNYEG